MSKPDSTASNRHRPWRTPSTRTFTSSTRKKREEYGITILLGSLGAALDALEHDEVIKDTLGNHVIEKFVKGNAPTTPTTRPTFLRERKRSTSRSSEVATRFRDVPLELSARRMHRPGFATSTRYGVQREQEPTSKAILVDREYIYHDIV
ncbi:hypothetical protein [Halorussus sp. GCM10023401]|uniref:hypothetical protein n=1 Tax=Halorussus sp. GCM10023401 TaxID=3252680 RepID=UPI00361171CD